jgi:two-component system chemotaxis sensor kinase CheA
MDVVRTSILDMSGRISMASDVGHGTSVTLSLPLTLAVLEGLLVKVADDTFVVPLASIQETLRLSPANLVSIGSDVPMVRLRDKALILQDLGALLAVQNAPKNYAGKTGLIVNATDSAPFVLAVDQIIDQRQIVIKGMPQSFTAAPGISGATILGVGELALIIEPLDLHTVEDGSSASNRTQLA